MVRCLLCKKNPSFNYYGSKPRYCKDHKKDSMINVRNKLCNYNLCCNRGYYYLIDKKILYCYIHKLDGMDNIHLQKCLECNINASFGFKGGKRLYCFKHKKNNMISITNIYKKKS